MVDRCVVSRYALSNRGPAQIPQGDRLPPAHNREQLIKRRAGLETRNRGSRPAVVTGKAATGREDERRERRPVPPGYWRWHVCKRGVGATREALPGGAWHTPTDDPRGQGRAGQGGGEVRTTVEAG